jgi:hypothetical protein
MGKMGETIIFIRDAMRTEKIATAKVIAVLRIETMQRSSSHWESNSDLLGTNLVYF